MSAKRWIKRIAAGVGFVFVAALLSGASYERAMRERSISDFPVPGRLVDVGGGRRIQLDCRGHGSPTREGTSWCQVLVVLTACRWIDPGSKRQRRDIPDRIGHAPIRNRAPRAPDRK